MPYALDDAPAVFLISSMAMHTQNLEADARASLLVMQPDWTGDPSPPTVDTHGDARRVPDPDAAAAPSATWRVTSVPATGWTSKTSTLALDVASLYYVGGSGHGLGDSADYAAARPDPLADAAAASSST